MAVGMGGGSASGYYNQSDIESAYRSVNEQTGIQAGAGGFDITVGGHTELTGAAIASTADPALNRLSTDSLAVSDLANHAEYDASSFGVSAGGGSSGSEWSGSASPSLAIRQSESESSTTASGISDGVLEIRGDDESALASLDRDLTELQHSGLGEIFDEQKVAERMEMGQVAGDVAFRAVGDLAAAQQRAAWQEGEQALAELQEAEATGDPQAIAVAQERLAGAEQKFASWSDGSANKTALHAMAGALMASLGGGDVAAGAIGAASNELLLNAVDEVARQLGYVPGDSGYSTLVELGSLLVGAAASDVIGDASAGGATALSGAQHNYLTHLKIEEIKDCLAGKSCSAAEDREQVMAEAEALSVLLDAEMKAVCETNPTSDGCRTAVNAATQYVAMKDAWEVMSGDVDRSAQALLDYVLNGDGSEERLPFYYNTIDNRANFFGAMDRYLAGNGSAVGWFSGAEFVARAPITGLGADGQMSSLTFLIGSLAAGVNANLIYEWRSEAGNTLMSAGFDNFRSIYNDPHQDAVAWDIAQLRGEQRSLQSVHERYLSSRPVFTWLGGVVTDHVRVLNEAQGQEGGVDLLDYESRVRYGCKLLGYSEEQGCRP